MCHLPRLICSAVVSESETCLPDCSTIAVGTSSKTSPVWLSGVSLWRDQWAAKGLWSEAANLADLIVSCCPSMVKFRTGTEKMWKTFFLAATLITLSTERGVFCRIDCVQICRHRKGPSYCFHPVSDQGISATCNYIANYSSMLLD